MRGNMTSSDIIASAVYGMKKQKQNKKPWRITDTHTQRIFAKIDDRPTIYVSEANEPTQRIIIRVIFKREKKIPPESASSSALLARHTSISY